MVAEEGLERAHVVVLRGAVARRRRGREERGQVEAPLDEHTGAVRLRRTGRRGGGVAGGGRTGVARPRAATGTARQSGGGANALPQYQMDLIEEEQQLL